jgi:uncharacterized membrane protein
VPLPEFLRRRLPCSFIDGLALTTALLFSLWYAAISFVNHHLLRTFAYDLGIKNQAIWDYAHFRWNYNSIMAELNGEINVLANHFEPVIALFSPLYWVFGHYTLLVVQWAAVLFGGRGLWLLFQERLPGKPLYALLGITAFYSFFGIFSALAFDFHSNVVAAMFVPWLFLAFYRKQHLAFFVWGLLILFSKENMALWLVFLALGLALNHLKDAPLRNKALQLAGLSALCFLLIMKVFMPGFANGQLEYLHFKYSALGPNMGAALAFVLQHPIDTLSLLFENHLPGPSSYREGLKWSTWGLFLLSGGWLVFTRPAFILMLLPIWGQKMFSDDPNKWSPFFQYSIEFLPVISLALIETLRRLPQRWLGNFMLLLVASGSLFSGIHSIYMYRPQAFMPQAIQVFRPSHWQREVPVKSIKMALKRHIPDSASVAASSTLIPRLAMRRRIFSYPSRQPSEYLALLKDKESPYPLSHQAFNDSISNLLGSPNWECLHRQDSLFIFRRRVY